MGGMAVVLGGVLLLGASAAAAYEPHDLGDRELRYEIGINSALQQYVARNGLPDIAEWRFLADAPPWDDHEVAVYYLDAHKELGFARAWVLGEPCIAKVRFERALSDDEVSELASRAHHYGDGTRSCRHGGCPMAEGEHRRHAHAPNGPAERAEAAADRAEAAANRVDAAAQVAERAADRSEAVVAKLEERESRRPLPVKPPTAAPASPSVAP